MTDFSYTNFLRGNNAPSNGGRTNSRPSSPGQQKFYFDLCERKRITPKKINGFTFDQLAKEIDELQKQPDPASQAQIDKIRDLEKEIIEMGGELKPIPQDTIDMLTGGREGTASSMVGALIEMRTQLNDTAPPSDAQLEIIVSWFLCPDIPFEDYDIQKKRERPDIGEGKWQFLTGNEFAEEIRAKMTRKEASAFIDRFRGQFYNWRRTRITQPQMNLIRTLESRLSNTFVPKEVEYAVIDGIMQQVTKPNSRIQYNTPAYEPLSEMQLMQMSTNEASEWIDVLRSDLDKKNNYQNSYDEVMDTESTEKQDMMNGIRNLSDKEDAKVEEFERLNDLIYAMESIMGYKSDDIHDMCQELVIDGVDDKDYKEQIREFLLGSVTADRAEDEITWAKEMSRLYSMSEESRTALEILPDIEEFFVK